MTTNHLYCNTRLTSPLAPFVLIPVFVNTSQNTYSQGCVRPRKHGGSRAGKLVNIYHIYIIFPDQGLHIPGKRPIV